MSLGGRVRWSWVVLVAGPLWACGGSGSVRGGAPADSTPGELQEPPSLSPGDLQQVRAPWIDFGWVDVQARGGVALFSEDFHIGPTPYWALYGHVPLPGLSPRSDKDGEYFGLFAQTAALPLARRTLEPELESAEGTILVLASGVDFSLVRNQSYLLTVEAGGTYASYGGITNLTDGFSSLVGLSGGLYLSNRVLLTLGTDVLLAHAGDHVLLGGLGVLMEF